MRDRPSSDVGVWASGADVSGIALSGGASMLTLLLGKSLTSTGNSSWAWCCGTSLALGQCKYQAQAILRQFTCTGNFN